MSAKPGRRRKRERVSEKQGVNEERREERTTGMRWLCAPGERERESKGKY